MTNSHRKAQRGRDAPSSRLMAGLAACRSLGYQATRWGFAMVVWAAATVACGGSLGGANSANGEDHALLGSQAPAFELSSAIGSDKVSLASAAGKVAIVDFWATWCEPCKDSFPHYQRLADKYGDKLVVMGISVDEEPDGIAAFAKETRVSFLLAWDDGQVVSKKYEPPTMPTSYVVDSAGVVRYVHPGFKAGAEEEIEAQLKPLLN